MSDTPVSTRELETPEHVRESSLDWYFERAGWVLIALVLIAALLGLLGPGPLSYRDQSTADGSLSVEYSLVERYEAPAEIRITLDPSLVQGTVRLAVSRSLVDEITPESISPVPVSVETIADESIYTFKMSDVADKNGKVVARFLNDDFGVLEYDLGLEGREPLHITQYVLP